MWKSEISSKLIFFNFYLQNRKVSGKSDVNTWDAENTCPDSDSKALTDLAAVSDANLPSLQLWLEFLPQKIPPTNKSTQLLGALSSLCYPAAIQLPKDCLQLTPVGPELHPN